jgi:hypothetical protein
MEFIDILASPLKEANPQNHQAEQFTLMPSHEQINDRAEHDKYKDDRTDLNGIP